MKKAWTDIPIGGLIVEPGNSVNFKTGGWKTQAPHLDMNKCTHCLRCHFLCPEGAIEVKDGKISRINLDFCKGCGICAEECPVKAIEMKRVRD